MKAVAKLGLTLLVLFSPLAASAHLDCALPDEEGVPGPGDEDLDGVCNDEDNCRDTRNPGQEDADEDGLGDLCDSCFGDNGSGDLDGDLYCTDTDCDDRNARVHPDAPELCDGLDNDCDERLPAAEADDDGDGSPNCNDLCIGADGFGDIDRDGFCGDVDLCEGDDTTGDSDSDGVCDDNDICEGDDASGDSDSDGACDDGDLCEGDDTTGDSDEDDFCDDIDLCEGDDTTGDSDSDGVCDDNDLCEGDDTAGDSDGDGVCADRDCRDDLPGTRPPSAAGAAGFEVCDGIDQDCNGVPDDNPRTLCPPGSLCAIGECTTLKPCYADIDADGFGDAGNVILVEQGEECPNRRVLTGTDCDDSPLSCGAECGPSGIEVCDGFDNDCSGLADDPTPECPSDPNGNGICSSGACEIDCNSGWSSDGEECVDIDECESLPCGANEACSNTAGGFDCSCGAGFYVLDGECRAECGDRLRVSTEECDDGNTDSGDGCSANCTTEQGWTCSTGCSSDCGDGLLVGDEPCDDGNVISGDGCSAACTVEADFRCTDAPSSCELVALCGDGTLDEGEECDDANFWDDDGCLSDCTVATGYSCVEGPDGWSMCEAEAASNGGGKSGSCASAHDPATPRCMAFLLIVAICRSRLPNRATVE